MNRMPNTLRNELERDPEYRFCAREGEGCGGRITWEHAILYAGKQVQKRWAIIPLCVYHHLGAGLDKAWNIRYAMRRANSVDRHQHPKLNWELYDQQNP